MTEHVIQQKSETKINVSNLIIGVVKWSLAALLLFIFGLLFYKKFAG